MKNIFTLFCLFLSSALLAQTTFRTAIDSSGSADYIQINKLIQLGDGTYIGAGTNNYFTTPELVVVKLDAQGNLLSQKSLSSSSAMLADSLYDLSVTSLVATSDGGFAVSGFDTSAFLIKFNSSLNLQWQKEYTFTTGYAYESASQVVQTPDGGFMMVGEVVELQDGDEYEDGYVQKTDGQGNTQWFKTYLGFNENGIIGIAPSKDGNYVLLASTTDGNSGMNVLKITPDGATVVWAKQVSLPASDLYPAALIQSLDGNLVFTGDVNNKQMLIGKLDSTGAALWSKVFTSDSVYNSNQTYTITGTTDSGYVAGGSYFIKNAGLDLSLDTSYALLAKLSSDGTPQWTKTLNGTNLNLSSSTASQFNSVIATADNGFAASGTGYQKGSTFYTRGLIYKFDNSSNICGDVGSSDLMVSDAGATSASLSAGATALTSPSATTSPFTITSGSEFYNISLCSNVLPVRLLSFTAVLQNKNVNVEWKTANETNSDYFTVERSSDSRTFADWQKITAKGDAADTYATTDFQPLQGTSYYRLKQVDKSGAVTYSNIVSITILANGMIVISPNPVHDNIHVVLQSLASSQTTLQVSDMTGKMLSVQTFKASEGTNHINLPAASLSKGVYVLKVIQNNNIQFIKFVKE